MSERKALIRKSKHLAFLLRHENKGIKTLTDIVERHGAHGAMQSLYLRDPDGNLVELNCYKIFNS